MVPSKVLVLTHNFIRFREDSAGQFVFTLTKELANDFQIFILAPHEKGLPRYEVIDNIKVIRFRYHFARFETLAYRGDMHERVLRKFSCKIAFAFMLISFLFNAYNIIRKNKIKILHCHWWIPAGLVGYLLTLVTKARLVLTTHGTDVFILRKFRWAIPLAQRVFKKAEVITVISSCLKTLLGSALKIDPGKIWVFPMPFDTRKFYPLQDRKTVKGGILSIGRLIERKGYQYLIEACRLLKDQKINFHLIIIGNGPDEERLKKLVSSQGLWDEVEIKGNLDQNQLLLFYNSAEVFVLPSITDWKMEAEGLGMVLLEAMACKIPVIGTKSGGIPDIVINEKTGLLVPEKNSSLLAEAIKRYLLDEDLGNRMAEGGYRFVQENFTPKAIAGKLRGIYQKLE